MKALLIGVLAAIAASPALAVDVTRETTYAGEPDRVWGAIGSFCAIGMWHPVVASCTETTVDERPRRTLALKDGGVIVEEEVARDDAQRSYTYRIVESPLPVADYTSTLTVEDDRIVWRGTFAAKGASDAEAAEVIGGIYSAGLEGINNALK